MLILVLSAMAASTHAAERRDWRLDRIWDDGKAEFCAYQVRWPRYGELYQGRALLILVKEPWNSEMDVKSDARGSGDFEVLKLNHVRDVPTGIYTYHQMASVYLRRVSGELQKLTATSSEACGITTALMRRGRLATRSYFEGQADREQEYPTGAHPEDGLPALLRDYLAGEVPQSIRVFPSLMAARLPELLPVETRLSRRLGVEVERTGSSEQATELRLESADGWSIYQFDPDPPHSLTRLEKSDGTLYELVKCERIAYWEMNQPGDGDWYPERLGGGVDY
jgi:hypothetical protein